MTEPVVLGRLGRPHGIRGEIRAEYYAESPLLLEQPLLLRAGRAAPRPVRVTSWRYWQGRLILRLDGVDDRSAAELLRGQELLIEGARLPEADEDEAYLHDMIDLPVFVREGEDGARPLVTSALIDDAVAAAQRYHAAAPAVPVTDTIKVAHDGIVESTPERSTLFAVQTPQVFDAELLKAALQDALRADAALTDDCSAVERFGKEVHLTAGDRENIKITTPLDLTIAEAILQRREGS